MEDEEGKPALAVEGTLPCGHIDSFEHRFAEGLLVLLKLAEQIGVSPVEATMMYTRRVMDSLYIQTPTIEEIKKLSLIREQTQEVQ